MRVLLAAAAVLGMRVLLAAAAVLVTLALPAVASAETRYASPLGTGTACTQAQPCDIRIALMDDRAGTAGIDTGDAVEIADGVYPAEERQFDREPATYSFGDELRIATGGVEVYGATTGVSLGSGARIFVRNPSGLVLAGGGLIVRDLLIWGGTGTTEAALTVTVTGSGSRFLQRILANNEGGGDGCAITGAGTVLTYALCRGGRTAGRTGVRVGFPASGTTTQRLQNVTAIAIGSDNSGIVAVAGGSATATLELLNVIARGTGMFTDVYATSTSSGRLTVTARTSNYRSRNTVGSRVTITEPIAANLISTVDPGFGYFTPGFLKLPDQYYRLGPDSPLIDAGSQLPVASTPYDLFGVVASTGQRSIGAYDYAATLAPPAPSGDPVPPAVGGLVDPGAGVVPPDPGNGQAGGGQAGPPTLTIASSPRAAVRRGGITVRSRVGVSGVGTVTQRVAVRRGQRLRVVCTSTVDVLQAGELPIACPLRRQVRAALRSQRQRLVVTTSFAAGGQSAREVHRLGIRRTR
jgi:hypothetical protein